MIRSSIATPNTPHARHLRPRSSACDYGSSYPASDAATPEALKLAEAVVKFVKRTRVERCRALEVAS